jgi:myo-inositol-1(or 4)-monophosphatase
MDLEYVQRVAVGAAYKGAEQLRLWFGKIDSVVKKGDIDLVTQADIASEQEIVRELKYRFPEHAILAEESGNIEGSSRYQWIVDPLDGTTNFAHGLGIFGVSIAFAIDGEPVIGAVLNPITGELFSACKGHGATCNGKAIGVSPTAAVKDSLLVTGFPYDLKTMLKPLLQRFENCLNAARGVRRLGSAALDLCYVACGRFEGFWEQNLKPWDTAAGLVIAQEAGATITDFYGNAYTIAGKEILTTNGKIHNQMILLLELSDLT